LRLEGGGSGGEKRPEVGRRGRRRQRRSVLPAACVVERLQAMDGKQLGRVRFIFKLGTIGPVGWSEPDSVSSWAP
jgi:hypothetical protein